LLNPDDEFVSMKVGTTSTSTKHQLNPKFAERTSTTMTPQSSGAAFSVKETVPSVFQTTATLPTWSETIEVTSEHKDTSYWNEGIESKGSSEKINHMSTDNSWSHKKEVTEEIVSAKSFGDWAGFTSFLTQPTTTDAVRKIDSVATSSLGGSALPSKLQQVTSRGSTAITTLQTTVLQGSTQYVNQPKSVLAGKGASTTNVNGFSESDTDENYASSSSTKSILQSTENSSQKDAIIIMPSSNAPSTSSGNPDSTSISQVRFEVDTMAMITFEVPVTTSESPETSGILPSDVPEADVENNNINMSSSEVPTTTSDIPETIEPTLSSAIQVHILSTKLIYFSYLRVSFRCCLVLRMSTLPI